MNKNVNELESEVEFMRLEMCTPDYGEVIWFLSGCQVKRSGCILQVKCHGKLQAITFDLRTKLPLNCIVNKRFALLLHDHVADDGGSKTSGIFHKCI